MPAAASRAESAQKGTPTIGGPGVAVHEPDDLLVLRGLERLPREEQPHVRVGAAAGDRGVELFLDLAR